MTSSDLTGTVDGTASTADLTFSFASCQTGSSACTVDSVTNLLFEATPDGAGPDGELTNKDEFSATIICGLAFQCTVGATSTR